MSRKSTTADDAAPIPGERRGRTTDTQNALSNTNESQVTAPTPPMLGPDEQSASVTTADEVLAVTTVPPPEPPDPFGQDNDEYRVPTSEHAIPSRLATEPTPADTPIEVEVLSSEASVQIDPEIDYSAPIEIELENTAAVPDLEHLEPMATSDDDAPEHTTIDTQLLAELQSEGGDTSHGPVSRDSGRGSKPPRRPTGVEEIIELSTVEELLPSESDVFDESVSRSASVSRNDKPGSTMILEGEEHRRRLDADVGDKSASQLGPAFPESDDELPSSSEMPTSARPGVAQAYRGEGPREGKSRGSGSITGDLPHDDDGWSDFQEHSDDWGHGDSVSEAKPRKRDKETNEQQPKRRRDTGRFKPEERDHPEPVVRLVAISAEDKGSFEIPSDDVTVGRESDNQVILKDPSISRKHARFTRTEEGWDLVDLQSGNGTFINGKRIERGIVKNNDEVRFGSATFKFVDTSDGLRAVDASAAPILPGNGRIALFARLRENPRLRTIVFGSAGLSVVLLVALCVMLYVRGKDPGDVQAFQFYLQGVEHFKQRKWDAAEGFFAAALQRKPEHPRSRRYLDAITIERRAEQALVSAKDKLNVGDLGAAYEQALLASDSLFFTEDANKILVFVAKNAEDRILLAKSALANDDRGRAKGLLDGLEFYSAYRADLNELRRQAGLPVVNAKAENIYTQPDFKIAQAPEKKKPIETSATPKPDTPRQRTPISDAIDALADGKIEIAVGKLKDMNDSREAGEMLDRIDKFAQAYDEGAEELKVKRPDGAIKSLKDAVTQLERITGPRGELSKRVRNELADALYLKGVEEYRNGQIDAAEHTLKLATGYSQNHQQSANLLTKIQTEKH